MKEEIKKLEENLKELKKAYEQKQKEDYENKKHKNFKKGDLVTNGAETGIVGWTENKACDCPKEKGYMGISLITGSRGFKAFAKRDEYTLVKDKYYDKIHKVKIELTGIEIEELKYTLGYRNCNSNKVKSRMLDYLDTLR